MIKLTDILKHLLEVRVINPRSWNKETPIKDSDVIRVYHGFSGNAYKYPRVIAKFGLSGKSRISRTYSYESGNNPRGLFVSIDFDLVKRYFANSGFIMEFHAKVSDLEAPVWNSESGGYFVQGQLTKSFKNDAEREARRKKNQEEFRKHKHAAISQSDRPDLAYWLLEGSENQALFTGDLNPNMIRAFWVNEELINNRRLGGKWERISRNEMIKRYPPIKRKSLSIGTPKFSDVYYDAANKKYRPNDDFDIDVLYDEYKEYYSKDEFIDQLKSLDSTGELSNMMYPKQINQFRNKYGEA